MALSNLQTLQKQQNIKIKITNKETVTFSILLILSIFTAVFYGFLFLNPTYRGDIVPYSFLLVIETYIVFQTVGAWLTMIFANEKIRGGKFYDLKRKIKREGKIEGGVDVFITTYNEPREIISKTVRAARDIEVEHKTYILDDGNSQEVREIAEKLGVYYITRGNNKDFKAGNINHGLKVSNGRYVVIFDADYIPKKKFLLETLPFFSNPSLALVQTPQLYRNKDNLISRGADGAQRVFYDIVLKGKNRFNAVFWLGTNAIFRREALEEAGGVYAHKSEDLFTTYQIHQKGWKTIYIPNVLATGLGPNSLETYHNQQVRWASGGFHMFFKQNPLRKRLTIDQKIQYLLTSSFYFCGIVVFLIMIMPLLYLLFGVFPIHAPFEIWAIHYIPFFLLQFVVILWITGRMNWESYILSLNSFVAHIQALFNTILSRETGWVATGSVKRKREKKPIDYLWLHISLLLLTALAIPVGLLHIENLVITVISIFWASLNILLLSKFIFFNLKYKENYS
jgi:cellulose synthase (UDP-forming)